MTIAITVNGAKVVVPGTYSQFTVDDSLANIAPGPRNIVIVGEASKGAPGSVLDLRGVYFNDYNTLKDYYGTGPIVDAARMLFTTQTSPVFAGSIGNLYVYKTNASGLATTTISQGVTTYGTINSAEYGELGNMISAQVKSGTTEVLPTFTSYWVPKNESAAFNARVSGGAGQSVAAAAEASPVDVQTNLHALTGVAATGGTYREIISAAQVTASCELALTAVGHRVTIIINVAGGGSQTTFQGADIGSLAAGDIIYIPASSVIKGGADQNVGAYVIVSATTAQIVADKISSVTAGAEVAPVAPATVASVTITGDQSLMGSAELMTFAPIVTTVDATTAVGTGASLELYNTSGTRNIAQRFWAPAYQRDPVTAATAAVASIAVAVSSNVGTFTLTSGSYTNTPAVGDTMWILPSSIIAGAAKENVGAWVITAAGSTAITARKVIDGGAAVVAVALGGTTNPFVIQTGLVSTVHGGISHKSSAEAQVYLSASRQSDGKVFPTTLIGGRVLMKVSYTGSATATLSINPNGSFVTSCANSADNLNFNMGQFATIADLVAYINSKTGYYAALESASYGSLNPKISLDQVQTIGIGGGVASAPAYNGRIKGDYPDFKKFMDGNFDLIAFAESDTLVNKVGLPDVQAAPVFLLGGSVGATNDAAIQAGFDAALKINGVMAVPLFSRDAAKDVEDGLTDTGSSYTIDAILQAAKSHALTASNSINRKERFAIVSYHGSFTNAKLKASTLASERVQMYFQMVRATDGEGNIKWFQPWMLACACAAGRAQANLGTSLLRKSFSVADVKHIGDLSIYDDTLVMDFDPDTKDLDEAIEAGLAAVKPVTGFGIRMETPDLSTRSRENDPKAWVYERISVLFVCDQVLATCRTTLDNYIGNRTTDTSAAVIKTALTNVLSTFVTGGSLRNYSIDSIKSSGNGYIVELSILPVEAVEFITLNVIAKRA